MKDMHMFRDFVQLFSESKRMTTFKTNGNRKNGMNRCIIGGKTDIILSDGGKRGVVPLGFLTSNTGDTVIESNKKRGVVPKRH